MPGQVVVFWTWQKEKTAEKAALCLKIFTCILSDLMICYRYVSRGGCSARGIWSNSPDTRIEIIIFSVTKKSGSDT